MIRLFIVDVEVFDTSHDNLVNDRKQVIDSRMRQLNTFLESEDLVGAYFEYTDLFHIISVISGSFFELNDFVFEITPRLQETRQKLLKNIKAKVKEDRSYLFYSLNLENFGVYLEYFFLHQPNSSDQDYDRFMQNAAEVSELFDSHEENLTANQMFELRMYLKFFRIFAPLTRNQQFNSSYFENIQEFLGEFMAFLEQDPLVEDHLSIANMAANMSGILMESDLEKAKIVIDYAVKLAEDNDADSMRHRTYVMLGHYYRLQGEQELSLQAYTKSIQTSNIPIAVYGYPVRHIGEIIQKRGDLYAALEYYEKGLQIFEFVGNTLAIARTLQYIGNVHYLLAAYHDALDYYEQSLQLLKQQGYQRMIVDVLYSHIRVYLELNHEEKANDLLVEINKYKEEMSEHKGINQVYRLAHALVLKKQRRWKAKVKAQALLSEIVKEEVLNHEYTIVAMQNLAELLVAEMQSEASKEVFSEAGDLIDRLYRLSENQGLYQVQIQALMLQSQFDMVEGKFDDTLQKLDQAEQMSRKKSLPHLTEYVSQFRSQYLSEFSKWQVIVSENASLEDRLANPELQQYIKETVSLIQEEKQQTEKLLKTVLPEEIIPHLRNPSEVYAEKFEHVAMLFADIVGFTSISEKYDPHEMVLLLNTIFTEFDSHLATYDVEKIRTIGDNYFVIVGAPRPVENPTKLLAQYALKISKYLTDNQEELKDITFRIGLNCGSVVAGVVGKDRYNFDVWGDAVNVAARMESTGVPGKIQVTKGVYEELKDDFVFEERGKVEVKGKEPMHTYFLVDEK